MNTQAVEFTREQFHAEITRLRDLMGQRSFWAGHRPADALGGLLYMYLLVPGLTDKDQELLLATTIDYDKRLALAIIHGIYQP
jgi:hypothetical protein